ncbi:Peptidase family M48 [Pustulibacterium marinum]|uniref:Peptidase family M48 n=1 Tax=Pustulibacterium marinum TaxID=1224947 RepID=A0A1I7H500_9FLAO|nr:M48 family metallopeptidase [Pustulibacterium marinum]SFU55616.1 Peptidase family M48 [Pustulibacterium marinum]
MKKIFLLGTLAFFVFSCKTNPFTGQNTLNFYPNSQIFPTAFAQYDEFLNENKVIKGTSDAQMIQNVGQKIALAADKWLTANGHPNYLDDYEWEYNLVQDETVNAWCMPGGKIVFYSGILPIAQDETGIAVVMGHEVAHALADHGAQRMSASTIQQVGAVAGNVAIEDEKTLSLFNTAYAAGTQVGVMLPFSRKHETEADKIGLQLMAIAGYNPDEAAELWKRMSANGSSSTPEFLSTHPSNETRIANLTQWAPEAKAEAQKFGVTSFK